MVLPSSFGVHLLPSHAVGVILCFRYFAVTSCNITRNLTMHLAGY